MITLDKNFKVGVNATHGFELHQTVEKIREKDGKDFSIGDSYTIGKVYYFPKLSQVLDKYLLLCLDNPADLKGLEEQIETVEMNIEEFSKTFYANKELIGL